MSERAFSCLTAAALWSPRFHELINCNPQQSLFVVHNIVGATKFCLYISAKQANHPGIGKVLATADCHSFDGIRDLVMLIHVKYSTVAP